MADIESTPKGPKAKRERSPSFPFIPLAGAIKRLGEFEEYFKRHPAPAKHSGKAWGMKGWTSQAQQTLAALKSFGLLEYSGSGDSLEASVSEDARTYLRAQQDSIKQEVLKRVALKPKNIAKYFALWGADRPPDEVCLDQLVLKAGFTDSAAKLFLQVYDSTIAYAKLSDSDKSAATDLVDDDGEEEELPPRPQVKVGDYVQWTSNGVDQFKPVRKVTRTDGDHAFVHGSTTGISMSELTVVPAPAPQPLAGGKAFTPTSTQDSDGNEISVLLASNRLQITADVDDKGLEKLEQMLAKYKEILKMLQ